MITSADIERITQALDWYADMGVDEAIGDVAIDAFAQAALAQEVASSMPSRQKQPSPTEKVQLNRPDRTANPNQSRPVTRQPEPANIMTTEQIELLAQSCADMNELAQRLDEFDACALKRTATQLCFADGMPGAHLMIIGEAPGREEDQQGRPFVGGAGRLLDKMLACIGLDRESDDPASSALMTNIVFWRPPGERPATAAEIVICLPFVRRAIQLAKPRIVVTLGAATTNALLGTSENITRTRGKWHKLIIGDDCFDALPMVQISQLSKSVATRKIAWQDLLAIKARLDMQS